MIESQGHLTAQPYSDKSDHIGETKKMIGEFERVMIRASKMYGSLVNTLLLDLANAHLLDIAAKDERVAVLEQITQHPLYEHLVKAEARITELEAQVQELIEELIEELKESANSAIESRSKEYAIKRLAQLTEGGK